MGTLRSWLDRVDGKADKAPDGVELIREIIDSKHTSRFEADDFSGVVDILADVRHFCDAKGIDLYLAMDWSYGHYLAERHGPDGVTHDRRYKNMLDREGCPLCERIRDGGGFGPSHKASEECESGKREHCTCDVCF